jgi:hypothetical protein
VDPRRRPKWINPKAPPKRGGPRLFAGIGRDVGVDLVETIASPRVTHVRYAVHKP